MCVCVCVCVCVCSTTSRWCAEKCVPVKKKLFEKSTGLSCHESVKKKFHYCLFETRHSRFGGTYVLSNVKSISDRDLIVHKAVNKIDDMSFDNKKVTSISAGVCPVINCFLTMLPVLHPLQSSVTEILGTFLKLNSGSCCQTAF